MNTHLNRRKLWWSVWVIGALLLLALSRPTLYGVLVPLSALALAVVPGALPRTKHSVDRRDLVAIAAIYVGVVILYRLAFIFFTVDTVVGLFLCFGGGMLLGVVGPIVYTIWYRRRPLRSLGFRLDNWRQAAALGLLFAGVQFFLTLYGYDLPAPVHWVPLMVLSLTVGLFEAVFFRGFIQARLEASFGPVVGVGGAAVLYAAYHVGYGMGATEMLFLLGLGVVYTVAFRIVRNLLVLWPLLTPMGAFFANVSSGDITMPWLAIAGFADVLAVMVAAVFVAHRRERRKVVQERGSQNSPPSEADKPPTALGRS